MRHKILLHVLAISINYLLLVLAVSFVKFRGSFDVGDHFELLGGLLGNTDALVLRLRSLFLNRFISKSHHDIVIFNNNLGL